MLKVLIDDTDKSPISAPLNRFHAFFEWKLAGFSLIDHIKKEHPKAKIYYRARNEYTAQLVFHRNSDLLPVEDGSDYDFIYHQTPFLPWNVQQRVASILEDSFSFQSDWKKFRQKYKVKSGKFQVVGKEKNLFIHPSAQIYPGVIFDTTKGPIIIEEQTSISPFSFLEGPLYIGKDCQIDNAKIGGGTLIGSNCRLGGEIENSIILDYSNKHHEGFLGHSFVGSWVNIGALATTSDLKNNYGIVKLKIGALEVNTGTIKFGSMISTFSKIAIGTMLNTGSVIDIGCNVMEGRSSGYRKPFSWLNDTELYRLESFLTDTRKIMARRRVNLLEYESEYLKALYEDSLKENR